MDIEQKNVVLCDWNPVIVDGNVITNTTDKQCTEMISSAIKSIGQRHLLLLGDSTMHAFWRNARKFQRGDSVTLGKITSSRCNWLQALGIKQSEVWQKPRTSREGPKDFNLAPWCTECTQCNNYMVFPNVEMSDFLLMDYIAVEFGRDVEMQSELGSTTQETLSRYFQQRGKIYSLCLANSGFHDMNIKGISTEGYIQSVKEYLELLFPICMHIIWIETNAPRGDKQWLQGVNLTQEWNNALNSYIETHLHHRVSVVRLFERSKQARHKDNVHMHQSWYFELAKTLFGKL